MWGASEEGSGSWCSPSAGRSVPGRTAGLTAPEPGAGSSPRKEPETMGEKKKKKRCKKIDGGVLERQSVPPLYRERCVGAALSVRLARLPEGCGC